MILVPVKNLKQAKQRLAPALDQSAQTELAKAMLHDVLEVLSSWPGRPEVAIVDSWHPYGALALMTPHAIRAPELPAGSVL